MNIVVKSSINLCTFRMQIEFHHLFTPFLCLLS